MQPEEEEPPLVERVGNAAKMGFGGFLGREMPKGVDHVEDGIDLLFHRKVGHVPDKGGFREPRPFQPSVAIRDGLFVQVISGDFVARFGKLHHESRRPVRTGV